MGNAALSESAKMGALYPMSIKFVNNVENGPRGLSRDSLTADVVRHAMALTFHGERAEVGVRTSTNGRTAVQTHADGILEHQTVGSNRVSVAQYRETEGITGSLVPLSSL